MNHGVIVLKAADLVAVYVTHNTVNPSELSGLVREVAETMISVTTGGVNPPGPKPAVPVGESYTDDYIICLEDGKKVKLLKRYLAKHFDMTPEEYLEKWGLPEDYPFVAKSYSESRSEIAKNIGLGKNP